MNEFLTVKEVSERLRISEDTVYRHINSGRLKANKFGGFGVYRISEANLEEFMNSNEIVLLSKAGEKKVKSESNDNRKNVR